jgi:hypothetical protein
MELCTLLAIRVLIGSQQLYEVARIKGSYRKADFSKNLRASLFDKELSND